MRLKQLVAREVLKRLRIQRLNERSAKACVLQLVEDHHSAGTGIPGPITDRCLISMRMYRL